MTKLLLPAAFIATLSAAIVVASVHVWPNPIAGGCVVDRDGSCRLQNGGVVIAHHETFDLTRR